jgi:isoquinoline 1-oxidoreductase subunit beta
MKTSSRPNQQAGEYTESVERVGYDFGLKRRSFVQLLGAGILITASGPLLAQRGGGRFAGSGAKNVAARVHVAEDGTLTVLTGKVEAGQGARAELTQAAAEELCVPPAKVQLLMADTASVPDDGMTAGSRSTPATVPAVRHGTAALRRLLLDYAAGRFGAEASKLKINDGVVVDPAGKRSIAYADLAKDAKFKNNLEQPIDSATPLTPAADCKVLRHAVPRPNGRDIVTGVHQYPSDIQRPGMWYGKVLRPPCIGARLSSIDLEPARQLKDVVVTRDEQFAGVAASSTLRAREALDLLAKHAQWQNSPMVGSKDLFEHLRMHVDGPLPSNPFEEALKSAKHQLRQEYSTAYIQHAPLEPRAAVAEWEGDRLTVWTGTQNPFGCREELARAFHMPEASVRLVVPDFGGGFGGKHSGEAGVEAARLAKAAGRPVCLRWTREEEFTWAYFRPAALIHIEASLNDAGELTSWHYLNINSGGAALETPYRAGQSRCRFLASRPPLRQGSYRSLAAAANNFARESCMDELAALAAIDPLEFRLKHLDNSTSAQRVRAVLEDVAQRAGWKKRSKTPGTGFGLSCGTEKGSFIATCAEVAVEQKTISVRRIWQTFECGMILNPENLMSQLQGAITMGLGPALRERIEFEDGKIQNASFRTYQVPRFEDVPELDIHLLDRPDLPSAGAGETPIIGIAPAIANAVFEATGTRVRAMPFTL